MAAGTVTTTTGGVVKKNVRARDWLNAAYGFATDRNDFRRNLLLNLGLFAAGVWMARNLTDFDLMAPTPMA